MPLKSMPKKTNKQRIKEFKILHPKGTQIDIPQLPKPKVSELLHALKGYVSSSISERLNALSAALLWYDEAMNYLMSTPELIPQGEPELFKRTSDIALKCRNQALGTSNLEERDTSLRMAIKQLEKCFVKMEVPKLEKYIALYDARKKTYEQREQNLKAKFGGVLELVEKALGIPFNLNYCRECQEYKSGNCCEVTGHALTKVVLPLEHLAVENRKDVPRRLNPSVRTYFFNQNAALALYSSVRTAGALPVMLRELRTLARQAAAEATPDGKKYIVNRDRLLALYELGLSNIEEWMRAGESPFKLLKQGKLAALPSGSDSVPKQPSEKKAHKGFGDKSTRVDDDAIRGYIAKELPNKKAYTDRKGNFSPRLMIYAMRASGMSSGWGRFLRLVDEVQKKGAKQ